MKKFWKWISAAVLFSGLSGAFSLQLLNLPAEIRLHYRTIRPVKLKLYPSRFMDRKIDNTTFSELELRPVPSSPAAICKTTIPLSTLRKIRLEVPPGSDFELSGISCRILGIWQQNLDGQELFSAHGSDGLELSPILTPETAVPASLIFHTGRGSGSCEFRLANDLPRFAALLTAAILAAASAGLLLLLFEVRFRDFLRKYLYLSIFLFLLFGSTVIEMLVSAPERKAEPKLNLAELDSYPAKFTRWYQRNLPFRDEIFALYARCCSRLGISPVGKVFSGEDGWLFIGQFEKQTPYEDYLGINLFTEDQLKTILNKLESVRTRLQKKNIRFALFIAPGKMHVYGDMLKKPYRRHDPGGPTRAKQLVEYLRAHSTIPVEYPLDEMLAARKQMNVPIYYQRDTHWNFCGAYIGARAMMRLIDPAAAARMPSVSDMTPYADATFYGDLARMIEAPESCSEPDWKFRGSGSLYRYFPCESGCYRLDCPRNGGPKVFFIRDSYLTHTMPHLAGQLSRATCYWDFSLDLKTIEKDRPDIVVLEMVDRYLGQLLNFGDTDWPMRRGGRLL